MSEQHMTTYRRADGDLVWGEFGWVADLDFFDDDDPGTEIIEEVWVLTERRIGTVRGQMCETCHGEGVVKQSGEDVDCLTCEATGEWSGDRITWELSVEEPRR